MKRYSKIVLIFIFISYILSLVVGCTSHSQPKGFICIEKAPIKMTYIDYEQDITPATVDMMVKHAKSFKYEDTLLNESSSVNINYGANTSESVSHIQSMEVK